MSENNNIWENNVNFYTTDGRYTLIKLTEADKENYYRLLEQTNTIPGFYDQPGNYEIMWKVAVDLNNLNYSIYNEDGEYCGDILIKDSEMSTPEIGIDLLVEKRNQGIAASCIKLLARTVHRERADIEFFVLRVSSRNVHSKHMIEKLGAIFVGEEDSLYNQFMKLLIEERAAECTDEERKEKLTSVLNKLKDGKDEEVVYRYKLTSDRYL